MSDFKYKSEVIGKNGIAARIVAKSKSAYSDTIIPTWECDFPKCILAELNTHCMLVRNAQSSRAVPVKKVIEQIRNNPVTPVHWGSNQAGMVAGEEIDNGVMVPRYVEKVQEDGITTYEKKYQKVTRDYGWAEWAEVNAEYAAAYDTAGYHKQVPNRPMEAFTMVRGVITGTEIDNFFHLRYHKDADPYIAELARCMWEAYEQAETEVLYEGEWHTPYYGEGYWRESPPVKFLENGAPVTGQDDNGISLEWALKTSSAGCGQVSYRKLDLSEETVERVWDRLMTGDIIHASVTGHQATPMKDFDCNGCFGMDLDAYSIVKGVTHVDMEGGDFWSAQFKHWIMHRKLIPNESFKGKFVPPTKEDKG